MAVGEGVDGIKVLGLQVKSGCNGGKDAERSGSKGGSVEVVAWKRLLQIPTYTDPCFMLLQKSVWAKLVSEDPQKRKKFGVGWPRHNRERSTALEIVVLLSGSL
jgi:hypothetical protein